MADPIEATALDGAVWIKADPATARDLAYAFSLAHSTDALADISRPRWVDDVVELHHAAAQADVQNGDVPEAVAVPLLRAVAGVDR